MDCKHMNFISTVTVARLEEEGVPGVVKDYMADIVISCGDCGLKFSFKGFPAGMAFDCAMVNFDGTELRAPIQPTKEFDEKIHNDILKN